MPEPEPEYVEIVWEDPKPEPEAEPEAEPKPEPKSAEQQYADVLGISVERFQEIARVLVPCQCGEKICTGWKSASRAFASGWRWPEAS